MEKGRVWRKEGDVFWFFLCVFAPLRFILIRVLQTIDHAVNPVLDEPIPKIDHQPESQVP